MKYIESKLEDAEYFKTAEEEDDDEDEDALKNSIFGSEYYDNIEEASTWQNMNDQYQDEAGTSKQQLSQLLSDQSKPRALINLNYWIWALLLGMIVVALIEFIFDMQDQTTIISNYRLMVASHRRIADLHYVVSDIRELMLVQQGVYGSSNSTFEESLKAKIKSNLAELETLQDTIVYSSLTMSQALSDLYYTNTVKMTNQNKNVSLFDLNQAISTVVQAAFKVVNYPLDSILVSDSNVFFVIYNMFNDLQTSLIRSSNLYV